MATENLYADSIVSTTTITTAQAQPALGAPDGSFTTLAGNTNWDARFTIQNPVGILANGIHTFAVRVRKEPGQSGTPTVSLTVYSGGTQIATVGPVNVSSTTGTDVVSTLAAGSIPDLNNIEMLVTVVSAGGSPSARTTVQVDNLRWTGDFTPVENIVKSGSDAPSIGVSETTSLLTIDAAMGSDTNSISVTETAVVENLPMVTKKLYFQTPQVGIDKAQMAETIATSGQITSIAQGSGDSGVEEYADMAESSPVPVPTPHPTSPIHHWAYDNVAGMTIKDAIPYQIDFTQNSLAATYRYVLELRIWLIDSGTQARRQIGQNSRFYDAVSGTLDESWSGSVPVSQEFVVGENEYLAVTLVLMEGTGYPATFSGMGFQINGTSSITPTLWSASNPSTPVTASDTSTISITETTQVVVSDDISVSDTAALSIAETNSAFVDGTSQDNSSIAITETTSIVVNATVSSSDAISLAASESTSTSATNDTVDSGSIAVSETASILLFTEIDTSDTAAIAVAETTSGFITTDTADTSSIAVTETTESFRTIDAVDSSAISVAETANTFTDRPGSDTASITISETTDIVFSGTIDINGSDSAQMAVAESATTDVSLDTTDSGALAVTDIADQPSGTNDLSASDTGALGVSETASIGSDGTTTAADSAMLAISETTSLFKDLSASDTSALIISESVEKSFDSTDQASLAISETTEFFNERSAEDSAAIGAVDDAETFKAIEVTDTAALAVSDTSSLLGEAMESATDSASIQVIESAVVDVSLLNAVEVYVYHNGLFVPGTIMVYRGGVWRNVEIKAYRSGGTWY